jgi:peptidyl-prolyl cis-trans isomerase B (cyclophilin B)
MAKMPVQTLSLTLNFNRKQEAASMKTFVQALFILLAGMTATVASAADQPKVLLETNLGNITLELDAKAAPATVKNFLQYVKDGFYNGTVFHRVISDFMIQGGGFTAQMRKKETRAPIKNEADNGLKNVRGSIAMARTNDPDSATAQFFINTVDNDFLNHTAPTRRGWGYAVFGKVVDGMDTVDKIRAVPTANHGMFRDVPVKPVVINKASVIE